MTPDEIADLLNALPFVRWDRCVHGEDSTDFAGGWIAVYGWITRDDPSGRADFVVLRFDENAAYDDNGAVVGVGFTTSSARWSRTIGQTLYGPSPDDEEHGGCIRVIDIFGEGRLNPTVTSRPPVGGP